MQGQHGRHQYVTGMSLLAVSTFTPFERFCEWSLCLVLGGPASELLIRCRKSMRKADDQAPFLLNLRVS